ncbi:MAG: diguanylate cyclase [Pseudomonadota bacterium]
MGRLLFLAGFPPAWIIAFAMTLASLSASPALASGTNHAEPSFAPSCHAATGLDTKLERLISAGVPSDRWTCSNKDWIADEPVSWLLFERDSWLGEKRPRYFFSRIARHHGVTFSAIDADGSIRTLAWEEADAEPFAAGPVFRLELPDILPSTQALVVRVERPHSIPLLTEARLIHYPDDADWTQMEVIVLAFVVGMLVLPLFFDISFYIVLRERFVLLHAIMVTAMIGYVLSAGGLISVFESVPLIGIAVAGPLLWAVGVGFSALFLADFLEEGAQSPVMRRITLATGFWCIFVPGFFALQLPSTQSFDDRAYFYSFVPVIFVISAAVVEAVARGSRGARFIAVAWTPIILASIERLLRGVGVYTGPSSFDLGIYLATGLEVVVISLAIADRYVVIRRERDAAVTEAQTLEKLSTRDSLTGLLNRRGLEMKFAELVRSGFDTFALVDLDRFKLINDRHGHQVGDAALVACAEALRGNGDPDLVAARLGGEEFVMLLRGANALQRAEALRNAIPMRISGDVEGLELPVTASIGAIQVPRASNDIMTFDAFYARADALMYEAKASGRNRLLYERLTVFDDAPKPRPGSDLKVA